MGNSGNRMNSSTTAEQAAVDIDLTGKICIITGCNTGIGKETARVLALHHGTIIMACRSIERGNEAKKEIVASLKQSNPDFNENMLKVMELDLGSLQSVRQFVINFNKEHNQLHYLINNAGIMALQQWEPSKENYELQFATNHIGHFYLTLLLTNVLQQSKPSRVVNVSSDAHKQAANPLIDVIKSYIEKSDGPPKETYAPWVNYGISKSFNILFAREHNRRYHSSGITSVSLHPGVIPTDLSRNMPGWMAATLKSSLFRVFLKTIPQGAATTVRCVSLKDDQIQGGHYYKDCNEGNDQLHQQFRINFNYNELSDEKVANDQAYLLWQLSVKLITQKGFTFDLNDANVVVEEKSNVEVDAAKNVTASTTATTTTTTATTNADDNNASSNNTGNSTGNQIVEEGPE